VARTDPASVRLERRVADFVTRYAVLGPGDRVVLLLSGGADSMALLAMLPAVERRLGLGVQLTAAHVDYRTRGAASDRDRLVVERACDAAGVPLHVLRLARRPAGRDFQARARAIRYRHAREVAAREGCTAIATAHNRDDQAETVLYRLRKYASPRGLSGMRPRDGDLAKPFLCLGAGEIRAYCRARGIEYGEDATNATPVYARNVLRLEVIPRLEALNPRLTETLAAGALQQAAEEDVLLAAAAEARARVAPAAGGHPGAADPGAVDVAALAAEPPALRALVLHELVRQALGGEALVQRRVVEALLELGARPGEGGRVSVGRGLEAVRAGGLLRLQPAPGPHECAPVTVDGAELAAAAGGLRGLAFCGGRVGVSLEPGPVFERRAALEGEAFVGLPGPPARVTLRHPRRGERFAPRGLGGETTVARFLAAARVPADLRPRALVVDVDGAAAWLGFVARDGRRQGRVAQACGVDESSRCTVRVFLEGT
jgi:tRNA(Ile)-lysidine synthase